MKLQTNILIAMLFYNFAVFAQTNNGITYFDQKSPGLVAQVFAPGLLSTDALEHSSPAFSPDGKTVVWAIMKMPSYQICLLEMTFDNNKWSPAHAPSFADTTANEVYPGFSADGNTLYFSSNRSDPTSSVKNQTLWFVNKTPGGWSAAQPLDTTVYKKDIYANSISKKGTWYFTLGLSGDMDWNIATTDDTGNNILLPAPVNSQKYEDGPFVAADESYLIFESDRHGTIKGSIDLYISFRKKNGTWALPVNMGAKINSEWSERFAKVSPDGKYLFFGRNTGNGFDIYWIDAAIVDDLKEEALKDGVLL